MEAEYSEIALQLMIIETEKFVLGVPLRSASKVVSHKIFGVEHFGAEVIPRPECGNFLHYLRNPNLFCIMIIRDPYDRYISGLHRDFWNYLSQNNIVRETKEDFKNFLEYRKELIESSDTTVHGQPFLHEIPIGYNFKIIPYEDLNKYIDSPNDEMGLKKAKKKNQAMMEEYANTVDMTKEYEAYDRIRQTNEVLDPRVFKVLLEKSEYVNRKGPNVTKKPICYS